MNRVTLFVDVGKTCSCHQLVQFFLYSGLKIIVAPAKGTGEAMALLLDSEAQFDLRISECKVPDNIRDALEGNGITTLASLSYSFGQPGQVIDQDAFAAWARSLEPGATLGGVANLRRLVFESQTQLLAILRDQVTSADTTTRKIPQAEREARMNLVRQRLTGVLVVKV